MRDYNAISQSGFTHLTFWVSEKQPVHETYNPWIMLVATERGKPHLPIQARLVRS